MRLLPPGSRSFQFRFRWSNTSTSTSTKIPWNLSSAVPYGFMSTLPVDVHGNRIEIAPNSLNPQNTGAPFGIPSSKETDDVSEGSTVLSHSCSTNTFLSSARDGDSRVEKLLRAPCEQVRVTGGFGEQTQTAMTSKPTSSTSLISMKESKAVAKVRVISALRLGQSQELLFSLIQASKNPELMDSIPNYAIAQIFRLLDPRAIINPYKRFCQGLDERVTGQLKDFSLEAFRDLDKLLADYLALYETVIPLLVRRRKNLGAPTCEILLNVAAVTGNRSLADSVWSDMVRFNHKPDVVFYNHFFETFCWPGGLRKYSWRDRSALVGPTGVKLIVSRKFSRMIADGVMADTKTFSLLMTACSRDGDLESVKAILKRVWHVDVDAITGPDDASNSKSRDDILPGSALYPTSDLLFTIAHIFGSNKRVAVAMRVVDHFSRRFSIPVDERTWAELATWIYILTRAKNKRRRIYHEEFVRLPFWTMEAFIKAMYATSERSMRVLNRNIRTYYYLQCPHAMLEMMILGLDQHTKSPGNFISSLENMDRAVDIAQHSPSALEYEINRKLLENNRDHIWISTWVQLLLKTKPFLVECYSPHRCTPQIWERQQVTEVVHLFWRFRHRKSGLHYTIETGRVKLKETGSATADNSVINGAYPYVETQPKIRSDSYAENDLHSQDQRNKDEDPN